MAVKKIDVSKLCRAFLDSRDGIVKESSYMRYENQIKRHISPYFAGVQADGLTTKQVEDFYKSKLGEGLSENYVHSLGVLLRTIYAYGERLDGIPNIPAKVELIKKKAGKVDTLNDRDILKVLRHGGLPEKIALYHHSKDAGDRLVVSDFRNLLASLRQTDKEVKGIISGVRYKKGEEFTMRRDYMIMMYEYVNPSYSALRYTYQDLKLFLSVK